MSTAQMLSFWRMWGAACKTQGWDRLTPPQRDEKRHEMLAALGFASVKDVGMTGDFDRVKKRLLELADKVTPENEEDGQRRRYLHRIGEQRGELEDLMGAGESAAYLESIDLRRFKLSAGWRTVEDLPTPELEKMVMTLDRCLKTQNDKGQPAMAAGEENPF